MNIPNLWSAVHDLEAEVAPFTILKQQASNLTQATKGILEGSIGRSAVNDRVFLSFRLIAPVLDHYSFDLFSARHDILASYPIDIFPEKTLKEEFIRASDADEFIRVLQAMLTSENTQQILRSLIAQSRS